MASCGMDTLTTRELGEEGERLTADYLERRGCRILARNWRTSLGEVDIVASEDDGTILFVEVKTRMVSGRWRVDAQAQRAVDTSKRERYLRMARYYQMRCEDCVCVRFDVAAVEVVPNRSVRLSYVRGAFGSDL
jgi:putative endonuclease